METAITSRLLKNRKNVILWFRVYLTGTILGIAGTIFTAVKIDNTNLEIAIILITSCMIIGCSVTFWQRIYYRLRYGKSQVFSPENVQPDSDFNPIPAEVPEDSLLDEAAQGKTIEPDNGELKEHSHKKERKGFGVYFALLGRSLQWVIMGFLFVTILNIIHVLPRGKRSMLNILMRFLAFAVMFPYSLIGIVLMIFIWGKQRELLSASVNKLIDWYDYDQS